MTETPFHSELILRQLSIRLDREKLKQSYFWPSNISLSSSLGHQSEMFFLSLEFPIESNFEKNARERDIILLLGHSCH